MKKGEMLFNKPKINGLGQLLFALFVKQLVQSEVWEAAWSKE